MDVWREVVPLPFRALAPVMLTRLAIAPVGLLMPTSDGMDTARLDCREVWLAPVETAEACSVTTIVTRSLTRLAMRSRPRSANCATGVHTDPSVGGCCCACLAASRT